MSIPADDLCNTVSSSAFSELDDDERDGDNEDPPELKYIPPEDVKTEIPEDLGSNLPAEDLDDDFLKRYLGEDDDNEERASHGRAGNSAQSNHKRSKSAQSGGQGEEKRETDNPNGDGEREAKRRVRSRVKKESLRYDYVDDADDDDDDWKEEADDNEDDWWPGNRKGSRKSSSKSTPRRPSSGRGRRSGSGISTKKKSNEEGRKKMTEGQRASRKRREEVAGSHINEEILDDLTDNSGKRGARKKMRDERRERQKQDRDSSRTELTGESDASSTSRTKSRRKRISKTTPEELEEARAKGRDDTAKRRRKKASEMTPEELEKERARWREERRQQRLNMSPEKREEMLAKARERTRLRRALAKENALPENQLKSIEQQILKDRQRKKARRDAMTEEQKREERQKTEMYRIARLARMTEDEKRARQMRVYLQQQARLASMTPEERERKRQKDRERGLKRYIHLKEKLGQEGIRAKNRNYYRSMSPERRERYRAKFREVYRKRVEKLKEEGKWEEMKKKWYERSREYHQERRKGEFNSSRRTRIVRLDPKPEDKDPTKVQKKENTSKRVRRPPLHKRLGEDLTQAEKEEIDLRRRRAYTVRKKLAIQKLLDSGMTMEEIQQQTETPEQRERRLIRARIRKAKAEVRKRLQSAGAPPDEIKKHVEEVEHTYQPKRAFRPYKPRPETFRRVDPSAIPGEIRSEIEALGEVVVKHKVTKTPVLPKNMLTQEQSTFQATPTLPESGGAYSQPNFHKTPVIQELPLVPSRKRGRPRLAPSCIPVKVSKDDTTLSTNSPTMSSQFQPIQLVSTLPQTSSSTLATTYYLSQPHTQFEITLPYVHSSHVAFQNPLQQPQTLSKQYSLQPILDGITFHESGGSSSTCQVIVSQPMNQQYDNSTTSSQHECGASSYYEDDNGYTSPPPAGNAEDSSEFFADCSYAQLEPQQHQSAIPNPRESASSPTKTRQKKEPGESVKKAKKPRPYRYQPSKNPNAKPRTKRADVIRDAICDECGESFNRVTLRNHKKQFHNPNYDIKNRICRLCGETYRHTFRWYSHYIRDHKPVQDVALKPHICEECGLGFANIDNYKNHKYYQHGDGLKKENHIKCPVCPEERLFKGKMPYYSHLQRFHPDYVRTGHDCYRCEQSFPNEKVLAEHVRNAHPESYFRCSFCTAVRFTQLGLNHHQSRCSKISNEQKKELKKKWTDGYFSLEWAFVPCELCGKKVTIHGLSTHYKEMHNVKEDKFICPESQCKKEFKVRAFWITHLEEKHQIPIKELEEMASKLNASDRSGMSVKPLSKGLRGRGGRRQKERKTKNEGGWLGNIFDNLEVSRPNKKKRRKITVIAEEEEDKNLEETDVVQRALHLLK